MGILRMNSQPSLAMVPEFDIVAYSPNHERILVVECKAGKESSPLNAAVFRRNLFVHGFLPVTPFFMLAYPTKFYLWNQEQPSELSPDSSPARTSDFAASARPVLTEYLGSWADETTALTTSGLETALLYWLSDLASDIRAPDPASEADKMLMDSGLYARIRFGKVASQVAR